MQHVQSLEDIYLNGVWLTIGSFDGVHRGHQEVIKRLVSGARANGAPAVVLTFNPHPALVLGRRTDPMLLTTPEERARLLGELGVNLVVTHPFNTKIASMTAGEFMRYLNDHLGIQQLWVGNDFALGHGREGNVEKLRELGQEIGYKLHVIPQVMEGDQPISSSRIRRLLLNGEVEQAAHLLGRPFALEGKVVPGDGRGKQIGVPTANLEVWEGFILPKNGVYACQASIDGIKMGSVTNIGVRPTFDHRGSHPLVETHILDFYQDLYGKQIRLYFLKRLRDEQKFPGIDALVQQIRQDIERARRILA